MIEYLFKTVLCSAVFLLVYYLFLEKEKMCRFNRFYLLGSIVLSLIIPLITFTIAKDTPLHSVNELVLISENIVTEAVPVSIHEATRSSLDTRSILLFIYWLVTAFLLVRFMVDIYKLYAKIRGKNSANFKGSRLILIEEKFTPHSFLNYIFLNKVDYGEGRIEKEILHHELTHVEQHHTIDILLIEFLAAFLWFNPFIYLYKRAIKLNHEFLADESVINHFQNKHAYQYLLLAKTNQQPALAITSQFNFLITKKRLTMITRYTSRRIAILKQSFALIIMTSAIFIFSTKVISAHEMNNIIQSEKQLVSKSIDTPMLKDTTKPTLVNYYAGGTKDGVSTELLKEYHNIIARNKPSQMTYPWLRKNIPEADRKRLEEIFLQMSLPQQEHQEVIFMKPTPPSPRIVPSQKQFDSFKNPTIYGVWVNEKKVPNSVLDQYSAKDFSQVFISKLYPNAKKGKSYSYQFNLMTNDYYEAYRVRRIADRSNTMAFQSQRPKNDK